MSYKDEYASDRELLNSTPLMEGVREESLLENEEWNAMELEDFNSPHKPTIHHSRTGSSFGAYFNVVCVVAGTGTLGMPYVLALGGWFTLVLFPLAAFLSVYSSILMIQCLYTKDGRRLNSLPELGYECFGNLGRIIVYGLHYSVLLSTPCLYILFTGLGIHNMMKDLGVTWSQTTWTILSGTFILIPCIVLKTLKEVAWIAAFGAISTLVVVVVVVILGLQDYSNAAADTIVNHGFLPGGIPMALATIAFAYGGNVVYPEVESTMRKPSDWKNVMSSAMISCSIMYLAVAIVGYLAYGENVKSPILLSLSAGFLKTVGSLLIILHVVLATPISICSFSMEWERYFHVSLNYMSPLKQFGFRALIRTLTVVILTLVALVIPFFNDLMSLIGAVSNCIMVFIFPLLCHLKLFGVRNRSVLDYIILIVSISVGTLGCILGAIQSIQALIDDYNGVPHKGQLH